MEIAFADGAASILIGLILAGTAALLAYETKGLLIGEAASRSVISGIRMIVGHRTAVLNINELRTMHLAPQDILLVLSLDFRDDLSAGQVEKEIQGLEHEIKKRFPEIKRLFIEVQSQKDHDRAIVAERRRARAALQED